MIIRYMLTIINRVRNGNVHAVAISIPMEVPTWRSTLKRHQSNDFDISMEVELDTFWK